MSQQSTPTTGDGTQPEKAVAARLIEFKEAYIQAASQIDKLKEPLM